MNESKPTRGRSQFVGLAGQYHVAYCLSIRKYHAALTLGNVPDVDLLVASSDGTRVVSLQVKTSRFAYRKNVYGHELRQWDVGNAAGKKSADWWYAFVDLQESNESWAPQVFLVPSEWVGRFVQAKWKRKMFYLPKELWAETLNAWDKIQKYLDGDKPTKNWVQSFPDCLENFWKKPSKPRDEPEDG